MHSYIGNHVSFLNDLGSICLFHFLFVLRQRTESRSLILVTPTAICSEGRTVGIFAVGLWLRCGVWVRLPSALLNLTSPHFASFSVKNSVRVTKQTIA